MTPSVRRAASQDIPLLLELSLLAAERRAKFEPQLWRVVPDAAQRVEASISRDLEHPDRVSWLLAEEDGRAVGAANVMVVPAPPVYTLGEGLAGLIADDTLFREDAPPGTLPALLDAAEVWMREGNAVVIVAACPAAWLEGLTSFQERGYDPLTLWMVKPDVSTSGQPPRSVRPAREGHLPQLVELNREAQDRKREANPRFWTPHADAPQRFEGWMRRSLTLEDRDLLVLQEEKTVTGFAVAQPANLPPAHDRTRVGLLDDFHAHSFGRSLTETGDDLAGAADLLAASEQALSARGRTAALVPCPAAWTVKREFLAAWGYHTANLWLLKA